MTKILETAKITAELLGGLREDVDNIQPDMMINVTYSELRQLRDDGALRAGCWYRLTDYECTTTQLNTRSAGNKFDIVILATDESSLSEECRAIMHAGDEYFALCNLNAWRVWYCLDNDLTRFAWVDVDNGKGVIYRLIDEYQNDCPYDFKNIQFRRWQVEDNSPNGELVALNNDFVAWADDDAPRYLAVTSNWAWCYTFNHFICEEDDTLLTDKPYDATVVTTDYDIDVEGGSIYSEHAGGIWCNKISNSYTNIVLDDDGIYAAQALNNIVIQCYQWYSAEGYTDAKSAKYNVFWGGCKEITIIGKANANTFGEGCFKNILGRNCDFNTFDKHCFFNTLARLCRLNKFGSNCDSNTFGSGCDSNTFGSYCGSNTFGSYCYDNTFRSYCYDNTFGSYCGSNTFGSGCDSNTFGSYCYDNTFGSNCDSNTFGSGCRYNTFGSNCTRLKISDRILNTHVLPGTNNNKSYMMNINFLASKDYCQYAGVNSSGVLKIWVPADKV